MKVIVNENACIGCGACQATCDEVFDIGDDGLAFVKDDADTEKYKEDVIDAIEGCPTSAISEIDESKSNSDK